MSSFEYPSVPVKEELLFGVYPVDFLLETLLLHGMDWFRTDTKAPSLVYGHLKSLWLSDKYGQAKIDEIKAFIDKYEIRIVQHFALIEQALPCISIQLLDSSEMTERAGLSDFQGQIDVLNAENDVSGREEVGYAPINDSIHIGIHSSITPDMVKYLYYLVIYILSAFKPQLEQRGMILGTFRATDLSRMNEYLPQGVYSRFINFQVFTFAKFSKGDVPIIDEIIGLNMSGLSSEAHHIDGESSEEVLTEGGLQICDSLDGSLNVEE